MSTATATALEIVTPLVKDWCATHADRIQACYLKGGPKDGVTLVLVGRHEPYDDTLSDALGELIRAVGRTTDVYLHAWQAGPQSETELCQVYPVKPVDRIFGE